MKEKKYKDILDAPQEEKRIKLMAILERWKGAVLIGEEGTGKTIISASIANEFNNTLMVVEAKAKKDIEAKLKQYAEWGLQPKIEIVSYHCFGDVKRLPAKKLNKFDFIILDEQHALRNYSARWTKRLVKLNRPSFLFMSATPCIKSPMDYIYSLRKTGCFGYMGANEFRIKFFGATPCPYDPRRLELGEFQNQEEFQMAFKRVGVTLPLKELDPDAGELKIETIELNEEAEVAEDEIGYVEGKRVVVAKAITKETKTCLRNGLRKVDLISTEYLDKIRKPKKSVIFCRFHEVAKKWKEVLPEARIALSSDAVRKEFDRLKKEDGILITTFGLTSSSLDLNECSDAFAVESTYSYSLDRQSFKRLLRRGKHENVNVTYFHLKGERSYNTSIERKYLSEGLKLIRKSIVSLLLAAYLS